MTPDSQYRKLSSAKRLGALFFLKCRRFVDDVTFYKKCYIAEDAKACIFKALQSPRGKGSGR
jgi:hypothetical protein